MMKTKIYLSQIVSMTISLIIWYFLITYIFSIFGIDTHASREDTSNSEDFIVLCLGLLTFVFTLLASNLLSYIFIARFLAVPRFQLEKVIKENAKVDHRENWPIIQFFYNWCLDKAYKNKF